MPAAYQDAFDDEEIELHAAIVERRGHDTSRVELWRELPDGVVALCCVADDRPGLLALLTGALVTHQLDVVDALVYCRARGPSHGEAREAVDFLWVRRAPANGLVPALDHTTVESVGELVRRLVEDRASVPPLPPPPRAPRANTLLRFERDARSGVTVLTIETSDRPRLLLALTQTIFRAKLQIVGLRATTREGRVIDRFEVAELDGSTLGAQRLLALQTLIFEVIEL